MVDHSLLKSGNKVLVENQPYLIIDTDFVNPGKGQAFTKIKIKNLLNKKIIEKTVKIGEELDEADVLNTSMQFLYQESNNLFFMNLESYEQLELSVSSVDFDPRWLNDGDECDVTIWNDAIIDVNLPNLLHVRLYQQKMSQKVILYLLHLKMLNLIMASLLKFLPL